MSHGVPSKVYNLLGLRHLESEQRSRLSPPCCHSIFAGKVNRGLLTSEACPIRTIARSGRLPDPDVLRWKIGTIVS